MFFTQLLNLFHNDILLKPILQTYLPKINYYKLYSKLCSGRSDNTNVPNKEVSLISERAN
jgi:hypothetical protein